MIKMQALIHDSRAPVVCNVILLLLTLYILLQLIINFMPTEGLLKKPMPNKIVMNKIPSIAAMHIFGIYQGALPRTQLELDLSGILAAENGQSQALISVPGSEAKIYNVGDIVPGGARIKTILFDRVILEHNGRLETLPIVRPKLTFAPVIQDSILTGE